MTLEEAKERLSEYTLQKCLRCFEDDGNCYDCYIDSKDVEAIETIIKELDILNKQIEHMSIDISEVWNEEDMNTTPEKIREFFRYKTEGEING